MTTVKNPEAEARLLSFLDEYADGNDLYWVPLTRLKKDIPVAAYDLDMIYREDAVPLLEEVVRRCGITRVMTFQTDSMEFFTDDDMIALLYEKERDGYSFPWTVETFYADASEQWMIYVSHEGTVSFTGARIVEAARAVIPDRYRAAPNQRA